LLPFGTLPVRGQQTLKLASLSCALWGHHVDNDALGSQGALHFCRCGAPYLKLDGSTTRVRHTLSCFLGTHSYERLTERHGCHEYVCVQCGHPLVYPHGHDPYEQQGAFRRRCAIYAGSLGIAPGPWRCAAASSNTLVTADTRFSNLKGRRPGFAIQCRAFYWDTS
jgi:hypothetical protein